MNIPLFITLLFVLQIFYWAVGKKASKKTDTKEDYFLAGKTVRFFPLMMTFLATQVGGGLVLGAAEEAYRFGWPVLLYPVGAALGLILLGTGVGRRLASFPVSTVAQIFEIAYGSKALKKFASLLSVISLFMILVAQIIASAKFLSSLGFENTFLFIAFWAIVILYTVQGGLKAVIATDIIQAAFFSLVFLFCLGFALNANSWPQMSTIASFDLVSPKLCGWLLMPLLFMLIEQDMAQRCFSGKCPRTVSKAALWAGIGTMAVCVVPIFFGVLANQTGLDVPKGASVLMASISATMGPAAASVVGCAVLAAVISTATSLINAISSNLSSDFSIKENMPLVRGAAAGISIGAVFFAFYFDNVVDMLIQSYDLSISCLFVPIAFALVKRQGNFISALLAIVFGILGFCLFRLFPIDFPKEIASIACSFGGYLGGEAIARVRRRDPSRVS